MLYKNSRISLISTQSSSFLDWEPNSMSMVHYNNEKFSHRRRHIENFSFLIIFYLYFAFLWLVRRTLVVSWWSSKIAQKNARHQMSGNVRGSNLYVSCDKMENRRLNQSKSTATMFGVFLTFSTLIFHSPRRPRMSQTFQWIFHIQHTTNRDSQASEHNPHTMDRDSSTLDVRIISPSTIWNIIFIRVISFAR